MRRTVEAVHEDGVLKRLDALDLPEHQRVRVTVDAEPADSSGAELRAWTRVYDGLAEGGVADVEEIALGRRRFVRPPG